MMAILVAVCNKLCGTLLTWVGVHVCAQLAAVLSPSEGHPGKGVAEDGPIQSLAKLLQERSRVEVFYIDRDQRRGRAAVPQDLRELLLKAFTSQRARLRALLLVCAPPTMLKTGGCD